jgi:hypothetical protein
MDSEAETVMQLRNELRDKEMKLTDIRLEALSSAHQLDQLREAMNRMQVRDQRWIAPGAAWERALESCSPTIQGLHTDCPLLSSLFVFLVISIYCLEQSLNSIRIIMLPLRIKLMLLCPEL